VLLKFLSCAVLRSDASAAAPFVNAQTPRPTLLFLPGTLCDSRVWQDVVIRLSANNWSCVHVDYRDQHRIADMAAHALNCATGRVIPIGLSMGGMVALDIWREAPHRVAAMALFDTNADGDTIDRKTRRDAQIKYATQHGMASLAESVLIPSYDLQNNAHAKIVIDMAEAQTIDNFIAQSNALTHRCDMWPQLASIVVPTLFSCGENDHLCAPETHERMAAMVNMGTFQIVPNAGHLASLDAPDYVADVLHAWLNTLSFN
jgi:pimeloyl-ACP methyl ester carboxylesterase